MTPHLKFEKKQSLISYLYKIMGVFPHVFDSIIRDWLKKVFGFFWGVLSFT
jgi:hypothetical protein